MINKWNLLKYLESQYLFEQYNKVLSVKNEDQRKNTKERLILP